MAAANAGAMAAFAPDVAKILVDPDTREMVRTIAKIALKAVGDSESAGVSAGGPAAMAALAAMGGGQQPTTEPGLEPDPGQEGGEAPGPEASGVAGLLGALGGGDGGEASGGAGGGAGGAGAPVTAPVAAPVTALAGAPAGARAGHSPTLQMPPPSQTGLALPAVANAVDRNNTIDAAIEVASLAHPPGLPRAVTAQPGVQQQLARMAAEQAYLAVRNKYARNVYRQPHLKKQHFVCARNTLRAIGDNARTLGEPAVATAVDEQLARMHEQDGLEEGDDPVSYAQSCSDPEAAYRKMALAQHRFNSRLHRYLQSAVIIRRRMKCVGQKCEVIEEEQRIGDPAEIAAALGGGGEEGVEDGGAVAAAARATGAATAVDPVPAGPDGLFGQSSDGTGDGDDDGDDDDALSVDSADSMEQMELEAESLIGDDFDDDDILA